MHVGVIFFFHLSEMQQTIVNLHELMYIARKKNNTMTIFCRDLHFRGNPKRLLNLNEQIFLEEAIKPQINANIKKAVRFGG